MIEHELNARPLKYSEVGEKFVVHPSFNRLVSLDNSIIIGPRGSGKTTMLRMLTPEALHYWNPTDPAERKIKSDISFIGLYVPMSRIFQDDLEQRYKQSTLPKKDKDNLVFKLYYLNIIEAILELLYFKFKHLKITKEDEKKSVNLLNSSLQTNFEYCYSINSLIREIANLKLLIRQQLVYSEITQTTNIKGEIVSNLEPVLKTVNEILDYEPNQKYAICLDELDIYATDFTAEIMKNLRGAATNIIFKLTIAPIHTVEISKFLDPPQQMHDYDKILLWPNTGTPDSEKNGEDIKYAKFSQKLAVQTLFEITGLRINLDKALGGFSYREVFKHLKKSEIDNNIFTAINIDTMSDSDIDEYVFSLMSESEPNFKNLIQSRSKSTSEKKYNKRSLSSQVLRKIKEIVFNRIITTKVSKGKREFSTKRLPIQYHGKDVILKAIDGNPRYLKKLMEYLAEYIDKTAPDKKIQITDQALALKKVKDLFLQRIEAIPKEDDRYGADKLIKDIGDYLSFKMNIDSEWEGTYFPSYVKIPNIREVNTYENTFRKAINNGALLIVGENDLSKLNTVKHKELRLNYLLHIEFRIPIRKYYNTSFENIIKINPSLPLFSND